MSVKSRLLKLEAKKINSDDMIVLFIDDTCTYDGKQYTTGQFYKLYPNFKNAITIEIE
jgi:predicted methyltransferase